jgi:glycosyltransferase involved in cell wall biosynthesis
MKILYLCCDLGIPVLGRHGGSVHVRNLVAAFERAGHRVVLAAPLLNKSPWEEPAEISGRLVHLLPAADTNGAIAALKAFNRAIGAENSLPGEIRRMLYNKDVAQQLKGRFTEEPPDFVYERASLYSTAGVQIARELGRPLVVELNAPLASEHATYRQGCLSELAAQAERWTLLQADLVLVVSDALRDYVLELGVDSQRVQVVPNAVDATLFRPRRYPENGNGQAAADGAPTSDSNRFRTSEGTANAIRDCAAVLGFVGGLRPWHGVDILPALLDRLVERHPNIRLVIVGDGPLRADLERDFGERGLPAHVHFTGAVAHEAVPDWIANFDLALAPYCCPDHSFYFSPLKIFEYMACGAAVVAARLGQIEDVISDRETGILYSPGNLDELAEACDQLLQDGALRQRLGQAAAHEVHRRYTWDHNASYVIDLVRSLAVQQEVCV